MARLTKLINPDKGLNKTVRLISLTLNRKILMTKPNKDI